MVAVSIALLGRPPASDLPAESRPDHDPGPLNG